MGLLALRRSYSTAADEQLREERLGRVTPLSRDPFSGRGVIHAPSWLDLFFDLSFVASLATYSVGHESITVEGIGSRVVYFTLLWSLWSSFVLFDVRFARLDWLSLIAKAIQFAILAFFASYSRGFSVTTLAPQLDIYQGGTAPEPAAEVLRAFRAWRGTCLTFATGCLLLAVEYGIAAIWSWKRKRSVSPTIILPAAAAFISGCVWTGCAFIKGETQGQLHTRLGVGLAMIALEGIVTLFVARLPSPIAWPTHVLAERMSLLTLIIIGEGILIACSQFSIAASVYGFDANGYGQFLSAICIIFLLWMLIFNPLNKDADMHPFRATAWAIGHFPLQLGILLLLVSVSGILVYSNLLTAGDVISDVFYTVLPNVERVNGVPSVQLNASAAATISYELALLDVSLASLNQSITTAFTQLDMDGRLVGNDTLLEEVATGISRRLVGQLFYALATGYNVELTEHLREIQNEYFLDPLFVANYTSFESLPTLEVFYDVAASVQNQLDSACLWTLPTAGGILILTSVLTWIQRWPRDGYDWLLTVIRAAFGFVLAMLGLLDLGRHETEPGPDLVSADEVTRHLAPIFQLFARNWLLPMLVLIFASIVAIEYIVLLFARRAYERQQPLDQPQEKDADTPHDINEDDIEQVAGETRHAPVP